MGIIEDEEETPEEKITEKPAEEITLTNSKVFAPIDCEVTATYDSKHTMGLKGADGAEILIHVGIDTVNLLESEHYVNHVQSGQQVKKGICFWNLMKLRLKWKDTVQ